MKVLKKIGSILFCLLPLLLAFGILIIVSFAGIFLKMFFEAFSNPNFLNEVTDPNFVTNFLNDSQFLVGISAIYAIIAALALGFWYWKRFFPKKQPRRKVSSIINLRMLGGLILLMLGIQYLCGYLVLLLANINPGWYDTYTELMKGMGFGDVTLLLALYSVLIGPISEELIFRGVTLKYAQKTLPFFLANILQALLFGVFHGNVIQGCYAFVAGLFFGYVCYRGGSIYLSILSHILFNLWGTFSPEFLSYTGSFILIHVVIFVAAAGVTLAGFFLYQTGIEKRSPMPETFQSKE